MDEPTEGRNLKRQKAVEEIDDHFPDKISCLPDALLVHILSFLKMDDVFKTSILSKRWRYLSANATCLDFSFPFECDTKRMVNLVHRSIISHEGSKVEKFCIDSSKNCGLKSSILRECRTLQIDSWVLFAITHYVEELTLDLSTDASLHHYDSPYKLPHSVFSCTSLTTLKLGCCDLDLPASVHLPSLKTLALSVLSISTDELKHLTSGCPLLEDLVLRDCNLFDNLHIVIENKNLKSLEIYDYCINWMVKTQIMISAPYLVSLSLWSNLERVRYCLENLPSLVKASFCARHENQLYKVESRGDELARLLGDLHHVKELHICSAFIGSLSAWEMQKLNSFEIHATHIELDSDITRLDLPGISYLLRNSSKLEDLTIRPGNGDIKFSSSFKDQFGYEERGFWESMEFDFLSAMQNLKTVKIYMRSRTNRQGDIDALPCDSGNMFEFIKFLLKNSKTLERMILNVGKNTKPSCNDYKLLFMFTESSLVLLPRASPNAEIHIL